MQERVDLRIAACNVKVEGTVREFMGPAFSPLPFPSAKLASLLETEIASQLS